MMTIGKHRIGWRQVALGLAALLLPATVHADVIVPHQFVPGTKIVAADVNENFSALAAAIDTKQNKIVGSCDPGSAVVHVNDSGSLLCAPVVSTPLIGSSTDVATKGPLTAGSNTAFPSDATITPAKAVTCMVTVNASVAKLGAIASGVARLFPAIQVDAGAATLFGGGPGAVFGPRMVTDAYTSTSNTSTVAVAASTTARFGCGIEQVAGDFVGAAPVCWVSWVCH
jgi:hypothetical protein